MIKFKSHEEAMDYTKFILGKFAVSYNTEKDSYDVQSEEIDKINSLFGARVLIDFRGEIYQTIIENISPNGKYAKLYSPYAVDTLIGWVDIRHVYIRDVLDKDALAKYVDRDSDLKKP